MKRNSNRSPDKWLEEIDQKSHMLGRKAFLMDGYAKMSFVEKQKHAKEKIKEFILYCREVGKPFPVVSFSGGKDSCVLRHLVSVVKKEMKIKECLLSVTSAELFHQETAKFIRKHKKPADEIFSVNKPFEQVIREDGYPVISKMLAQKISHVRNTKRPGTYVRASLGLDGKVYGSIPIKYFHFLDQNFVDYKVSHKCCDAIKGKVKHDKRPCFIGTTIDESRLRKNSWIKFGCNLYTREKLMSRPLSLWTEKDVWQYINDNKSVDVSEIYGFKRNKKGTPPTVSGYKRSGCVACMFGLSLEEEIKRRIGTPNRFELLYKTNRKQFDQYIFDKRFSLWKPITDLNIKLNVDSDEYLKLYSDRKKQLDSWRSKENKVKNVENVLDEIEERAKKNGVDIWTKQEKEQLIKKYSREKYNGN